MKADDYSFFKKRVKLNTSDKEVVIYKLNKAEIDARKRKTPNKKRWLIYEKEMLSWNLLSIYAYFCQSKIYTWYTMDYLDFY